MNSKRRGSGSSLQRPQTARVYSSNNLSQNKKSKVTFYQNPKLSTQNLKSSILKPGTYKTDLQQHGIKYTNNEYVKYFLLQKIINKFPLLKPMATIDQEKLYNIKRELVELRIENQIVEEKILENKTRNRYDQRQLSLISNKNHINLQ